MRDERASDLPSAAYWRAVASIPVDRRRSLADVERLFTAGSAPQPLDGFHRGRLVAVTVGAGLDQIAETLGRLWMPWKGKTFNAGAAEGRNVFSARGRFMARLLWPGYHGIREHAPGLDSAFRFVTSVGESAIVAGTRVLRIDYDLTDNPAWPIRRVLDEVVRVDEGLHLGHALVRFRGRWRRAAWFSLEA